MYRNVKKPWKTRIRAPFGNIFHRGNGNRITKKPG